jgi:phospholipase C
MSSSHPLKHAIAAAISTAVLFSCATAGAHGNPNDPASAFSTATPIKHVVVIFQENVSFDHYFGTYPHALNPAGEPAFHARPNTRSVNGLNDFLLNHNPNSANPQRLNRSEALTCDQDHNYGAEQKAFDGGLMDKFVEYTDKESCGAPDISKPGLVMDYYDGNTVTAMWNYAQHFAMSDNSYNTTFGPSAPGALNLVSGQTHGAVSTQPLTDTYGVVNPDANGVGTVINDPDPTYDDCSSKRYPTVSFVDGHKNVGDLLNARNITWGWFEGGFRPTSVNADGTAVCGAKTTNIGGVAVTDYIPHHEPFQYYASTSNPHHLPPTSVSEIGHTDQANHQYDLQDFWNAVDNSNLPAVSFLKAKAAQDGHAGYSDPLDEQQFIVNTINRLEQSPEWNSTAVVIAYDDSDGWYDHVMGPIVSQSNDAANDALVGAGLCGENASGTYLDRCGYGPRLPLLVISPYAKRNFVDHGVTDQSSILRFIEDNWQTGRIGDDSFDAKAGTLLNMFDFRAYSEPFFLDPVTGLPMHADEDDDGHGHGHHD